MHLLNMENKSMRNQNKKSWCRATTSWEVAGATRSATALLAKLYLVAIEIVPLSSASGVQNKIFKLKHTSIKLSECLLTHAS